ncbi:MAG: hypothetical protein JXQ29_00630 [Planctomycetes bacterium]|nr:hypothetical protein [Planctomycetota bacterium]
MRKHLFFLAALGLVALAGAAVAQTFSDGFLYKPGTTIPGYTEQRGDWQATGVAVQSQAGVSYQELTYDKIKDTDCCVEVLAVYDTATPGLMYTGPLLRYSGAGSTASYFMVKVQDNGTPRDGWDYYFTYYYDGVSMKGMGLSSPISPPTKQARVRLQVLDQGASVLFQVFIDTDLDGKWNITNSTTTTTYGLGQSGLIGINGYQNAIADDLKFFDACLWLTATPQIGTLVKLAGRGQGGLNYQGACSFANTGISLGSGRKAPLALDSLFFLSLSSPGIFQNFSGTTAVSGDFTMGIKIPSLPALAGLTIYTSAITYNRLGVAEICPDVEVTFVP